MVNWESFGYIVLTIIFAIILTFSIIGILESDDALTLEELECNWEIIYLPNESIPFIEFEDTRQVNLAPSSNNNESFIYGYKLKVCE